MKVVFLEDVEGVAQGGDVKEVKNGFARNFLIPKNLAVPATHNALQQITSIAQKAEEDRTRTLTDMRALADIIEGTQISIEMRSGVNNRLYGSVTNAVLADELSSITSREIDRRTVILAEPIRELGLFEVTLRLHQDVEVPISVLVYPIGSDPEKALAVARGEVAEESEESTEDAAEEPAEEAVASVEDAAEEEAAETIEEADVEEAEEEEEAATDEEEEEAPSDEAEEEADDKEASEESKEES